MQNNLRNTDIVLYRRENNALSLPVKPAHQSRTSHRRISDFSRLKEIKEFSLGYEIKMRKGIFLAFLLIFFSFLCLILFTRGIDITAFFSVGALIIMSKLFKSAYEFYQEETRIRITYHNYLSTFSYRDILTLQQTSKLSAWSEYEIEKYLKLFSWAQRVSMRYSHQISRQIRHCNTHSAVGFYSAIEKITPQVCVQAHGLKMFQSVRLCMRDRMSHHEYFQQHD